MQQRESSSIEQSKIVITGRIQMDFTYLNTMHLTIWSLMKSKYQSKFTKQYLTTIWSNLCICIIWYLFINYNTITNYILIIYELSNFDHLLGVVSLDTRLESLVGIEPTTFTLIVQHTTHQTTKALTYSIVFLKHLSKTKSIWRTLQYFFFFLYDNLRYETNNLNRI